MRKRAEGMTSTSDSILELLREKEVALSSRGVEVNLDLEGIDLNYRTIKMHIARLNELGLIEKFDETGGWYRITEAGEAYLDGELDASELES